MRYFLLFPLVFLLLRCEDPIDVPSPFEASTLVVDAWLTNTDEPQTIRLTESVDYFRGGAPPVVANAEVTVCRNDGEFCWNFVEAMPGVYSITPDAGEGLGDLGDVFTLEITTGSRILTATSALNRTAIIDSISIEFEEESLRRDGGKYAQLYARDHPGQGDTYWAKVWKNDTLLNRPSEIILTFDGAFDSGTDIDGLYFLPPLREINPFDDDGADVPYVTGDSIYVEVHSISNLAWQFLTIATEQIGNSGIFSVPVANARGNVTDMTSDEAVFGIFNVAEVARIEQVVE